METVSAATDGSDSSRSDGACYRVLERVDEPLVGNLDVAAVIEALDHATTA